MATKPTSLPRWATSGSALLVEPNDGKKDIGWVVNEPPPAQVLNWQKNLVYQWCAYLNDLENQALVFTKDLTMPRLCVGFTNLGTLTNAGHVTLAANVGLVKFKTPGSNSAYLTITLPTPTNTASRPLLRFRMLGNFGFTSQVFFVAPAEAGLGSYGLPPTNYYGFFVGGSANNGHIEFCWTGSKWDIVWTEGLNVAQSGGGIYA